MEQRTITAKDVLALLKERYSNGGEWVCASEVQRTTGWSDRRYDFVAMNCWNSNFYKIEVVEIKVSKSDLRRELEEPEKHNVMFDDIDYYSLAAPDKVIDMSIIPPKWVSMQLWTENSLLSASLLPSMTSLEQLCPALLRHPS